MKTSSVSLSVLIPNYNHAAYLRECLDSVVSQSCQPDAIQVIDDASTDDSVEIIRSYVQRFPRIQLVQRSKNSGVHAVINDFLPQVQGTHLLTLAADDYMMPGSFEKARNMLNKHPDAGLCLTNYWDVYPGDFKRLFDYKISRRAAFFPAAKAARALRGLPLTNQCFIHLAGLREIGGFPASLRWHVDHFVCSVLALRHGFCYLPEPGGAFRKLAASYSAVGIQGQEQAKVMASFLDYFSRPEYSDVKAGLRDSHALAIFDRGLLSALALNGKNRYFLSPSLLAKLSSRRARRVIRHPMPAPVKKWVRRQFSRPAAVRP